MSPPRRNDEARQVADDEAGDVTDSGIEEELNHYALKVHRFPAMTESHAAS